MLTILLAAPLFLLATPQEPDADYEVVRVIDGRMLIGEILEHDLDGLTVQSARNGGTYRLAWGDLFPGEADRLKTSFGYRVSFEAPTVTADRLLLVNGQQITGRIMRRDNREIEIRSRGATTVVPTNRLAAPPEKVVVDAIEVLTPEQFYTERLPQVPLDDAMAQFDFARELEAVAAYDQALVQLLLAQQLAEGDDALLSRIEGAIPRIQTAIEHRVETDKLREIRTLIFRERFAEAEEQMEAFKNEHDDSPVYDQFIEVEEKFEEQREAAMVRYLERNWYKRAASMLKKRALDRKATVETLQQYATAELPDLMRKVMAEELATMKADLGPAEISSLWEARMEDKKPKRHQAGFGNGTWILGEARARAGLKNEQEDEQDTRSAAERELQDRYKRYLENLERSRRAAGTNTESTPEDWWSQASASSRFQWLLAFYAEFSGDFELVRVMFDECATCNGDGSVEIIEVGGGSNQPQRRKCPTCQGVTIRRTIFFR